jgi:alkanesulfonate monooxygenase SsuD/methylene tetrahydromethanopterin reductase-like flavin-dependent oxidoreductase (luciferase family)
MKLSIAATSYSWPGDPTRLPQHLVELARQVDDAGLDTLWVADHLLQMDPNASIDEPMLEAYTTLGYLAAATNRVHLGTLVTWATIRPPTLLVVRRSGPHHHLDQPISVPAPVRRPRVLIGGMGEQRTLPLVAATQMPATSLTSPTAARPSDTSSTSSPTPVTPPAATPTPSRSP